LEDKLDFFVDTSRESEEERQKTGLLKLRPFAVLGQFSQKSSFLINDYELLKEEDHRDLDTFFAEWFANDPELGSQLKGDNLFNTFPIDASQEEVMKAVRAGESCVVQGPPGSGKSQLICNLVTDFTSRGKKVLVVSQKRVALDVVFKRLGEQGFGPFIGLVHDFRADRKDLYRKISHQINSLESYEELNRGLDAIQLERNYNQLVNSIERYSEFLEEYKAALFDRNESGIPVKEIYLTSSMVDEHIDLTQYYKKYPFSSLEDTLRDFREYIVYYRRYENPASFWLHRMDFSGFGPGMLGNVKQVFDEIREIKASAISRLGDFFSQPPEFPVIHQSLEKSEVLLELLPMVHDQETFLFLKKLMGFDTSSFDLLWLQNKLDTVQKLLRGEGIEWSIDDAEVETVLAKTIKVLRLNESWWQSLALYFDRKNFNEVWALLKQNGLREDSGGLKILVTKLENRLNLNHQYTLLNAKPWIELPRKPFDAEVFDHFSTILTQAIDCRFMVGELGMISDYLGSENVRHKDFLNFLEASIALAERLKTHSEGWKKYLTPVQIKHLLVSANDLKLDAVQQSASGDLVELVAFDKLKKNLRKVDLEVFSKLTDQYPEKDKEALEKIFVSSLKLSWLEHIEAKYPVLQEIGTLKIKSILEEFALAVEERLRISKFIAELRLRERTFRPLEYNRLNNLITYRDLGHQVTKKKLLWPIKKLVEKFEDEIFRLLPCWLTSPETVSAIFPLKSIFDLIVFDESSQCFVERGLPALLRAKQVVIAGDSKQLPPYDLYQRRTGSEEEGIELESSSLLELGARYFKSFSLQGHYRSQSLPLIQFSNKNFYDNSLSMLPDKDWLNKAEPPFEWLKVDGVWDKQSNVVEAEAVVDRLKDFSQNRPAARIGVITFNYYQMELILELLSQVPELAGSETIEVKNIENVQGDEYDIVLFSVGYARNKQGKFTANFGLLSRAGGENRLNVAVTRAREKIVLVSSITYLDFPDGQLKNEGVRLLRDYLRYVEEVHKGWEIKIETEKPSGFKAGWYLKDRLQGEYGNHEVRASRHSPAMDLELLENGDYVAGILTDDHRLFSAKSAKEAFVYHPQLLRSKNWNVVHIFSRQYWLDREDLLQTKLRNEENYP
ncbi:MAG TPA: AAA domain-containing protein, partial [Cyclobacteriaceae bacterium]|nr:AAA domain-containing protein [Cyclobacteriaceae bacterium]